MGTHTHTHAHAHTRTHTHTHTGTQHTAHSTQHTDTLRNSEEQESSAQLRIARNYYGEEWPGIVLNTSEDVLEWAGFLRNNAQ